MRIAWGIGLIALGTAIMRYLYYSEVYRRAAKRARDLERALIPTRTTPPIEYTVGQAWRKAS